MKETLTSRERVKRAVARQPVDRMPIDFGVHFSTGISLFAYQNLRQYLGLDIDKIEMADPTQLLARVDKDILDRFRADTMLLNPAWPKTKKWNPRGNFHVNVPERFSPTLQPDGSWILKTENTSMRMPAGGFFFDGSCPDMFGLSEEERRALFARRAEEIYKETDKYTMMMGYSGFFGDMDFACDMLTDPESCHARNEQLLQEEIAEFDKMNARMGKYVNAIEVNGDLGIQSGPACTPDSYEDICYPYLKRFCEHVHNTSDIQIFMHTCGSIYELMPYVIAAGTDAVNPVQISARNMDPKNLKADFGKDICFWGGGCDTQVALWSYKPEEIKTHVKELVEIFKPGSGFVFNQVHNIMGDVPPENIVAMFDTAYENSFYTK